MTEDWKIRRREISVRSNVTIHEGAGTTRGATVKLTNSDDILSAYIDGLGGIDTFGVSRGPGTPSAQAEVKVPASIGPAALLVQDLETGQWAWNYPELSGGTQRFTFDVPETTASRGIVGGAARLLVKVVGLIGADQIAGAAADWSVGQWERLHRRSAIVRFRQLHSASTSESVKLATVAQGRSLLLLHDVFGSTASTFGGMSLSHRRVLHDAYGGRIWGFDHATLASSPKSNAERLVELLAERGSSVHVDIIGVGRGGLVAAELAGLPTDRLSVGRVALVGTPLRGTPLCSGENLKTFVNRYTNLLSLIPDNPVTTTLDAVCALVAQLGSRVIRDLDGLAAMAAGIGPNLPIGPTFAMFAGRSPERTDRSWVDRLKGAAVDSLLGSDHDDVVPVASAGNEKFDAPQVAAVSHRELVSSVESFRAVVEYLAASAPPLGTPGDTRDPVLSADAPRVYTKRPHSTSRRTMELTVVHGTIALESETVIVGHFLGTGITGAEAAIDVRAKGRMSSRHLARLYPGSVGESEILPNSIADGGTDYPRTVVIVGLGVPGELSRVKLADTVTAGLLKLALNEADRTLDGAIKIINLSTVLIGMGGLAPLPVEDSITGVVDGVLGADARSRELLVDGRPVFDRVQFGGIRFVELQEDVAEIAARTVSKIADLARPGWRDRIVLNPKQRVRGGDGGLPRRVAVDDDPEWRRIVVRQLQSTPPTVRPTLAFTVIGGAAATTEQRIRPNVSAVNGLLQGATGAPDGESAATLFRLLVPRALRSDIATADNLHFIVDRDTAKLPWEALIYDGGHSGDQDALSRRAGLIRQFVETEAVRRRPNLGDQRSALVIGNPPTNDLPTLLGAAAEADRLEDRFSRHGFETTTLRWPQKPETPVVPTGATPVTRTQVVDMSSVILQHVTAGNHRVLHIAAHGQMSDDRDRCGVVIGPDSFLTAEDICQLGDVPELVFLNCCRLAADPGLAANLAGAFMETGAQAVIAAAWPIGDDTALRFADRFYLEMLEGATFGAAVKQARRAAFGGSGDMTWAAYQCYGDPGYRLEAKRGHPFGTQKMVSPAEFLRAIDIIRVRAGDVGRRGGGSLAVARSQLLAQLNELHDSELEPVDPKDDEPAPASASAQPVTATVKLTERPGKWLTASAYESLGAAAAELGDLSSAIEWYGKALVAEKATGSVKTLEQMGNIKVRYAVQQVRDGASYDELLTEARDHLEQALAIGLTSERLSLLGSYWKKRAVIEVSEAPDAVAASVAHAVDFYRKAAETDPDKAYPVLAHLQLNCVHGGSHPDPDLKNFKRAVQKSAQSDESYWERAALADAELTRLVLGDVRSGTEFYVEMYGKSIGDQAKRILAGEDPIERTALLYVHAFGLRSSWRERASVLDHIRDLVALTTGEMHKTLTLLLNRLMEKARQISGQDE